MLSRRLGYHIFALLLVLPAPGIAQFIFQNFNQKDGLSGNHVRCLYKDREGFLWIGTTNGLNRYDGSMIRRFKSNAGQKDFFINAIQPIDQDKILLVGTPYGLRTFSKQEGRFYTDQRFDSIKNKVIQAIHEDNRGWLWILSYTDIYIYANGKVSLAQDKVPATRIMEHSDFTYSSFAAFCWDPQRKGFWVGGSQTYFIDCLKNQVYHRGNNPLHYPLLNISDIVAIAVAKNSDLWFSTRKKVTLNHWNHLDNSVEQITRLDGEELNDSCNLLFIDSQDRLWISTYMHSAYYKLPGQTIKKIRYHQNEPNSIGYGLFRDAMEDPEGNIWLATLNGVSKSLAKETVASIFSLPSYDFFLNVNVAPANSIAIQDSLIIAAKSDGVVVYNMNNRTHSRFAVTDNRKEYIRNSFLMAGKGRDRFWFAGEDGVYYLMHGAKVLKKLSVPGSKAALTKAEFVFEDQFEKIWFHISEDALYRYHPESGQLDRFDGSDPKWGIFPAFEDCPSYLKLKNGKLLFPYYGMGFLEFDPATEKFKVIPVRFARHFKALRLVEDRDGYIWSCAWGRGILKMNARGDILDSLNTSNGLASDYALNMDIDQRGYIWTASKEGLMFFDPKTKDITKVQVELGTSFQNQWSDIQFSDEKIYAVMMDQVAVFNPSNFATIKVRKPPHITSVKVLGENNQDNPEKTDLTQISTLELEPDQDFIELRFASLNHQDIPSLVYSYQLEGNDKDWIYAGRNTSVNYNNLRPGTYTFKVRSVDENGQWMKDITTLKIHLLPRWWQTWWFISVMALVLGLIAWLGYRNYLKRKQKDGFEKTIDYFANSVYGDNSVSEICWDIARNCISQLLFEDCVVFLWDNEKGKLVQKATYSSTTAREYEIDNPIELALGEGIAGTAAATKKAIIVHDTSKDRRYVQYDEMRYSEISIPIMHEGEVIGVIDSEHSQKNFFTKEHMRTLSTIASISANKIAEAQAEAEAQQKEIMLLEINKMLAESQLMALRAQMNPHFVFNCLNSIQECIVTEKYEEASKYLNKFSKLFRMVLHNSDRNFVTIDEEKEVLELYLELEQMRFEQSFTYQIIVDEELEAEEILLPSMLLQPYVENALWHGLMHKKGERDLYIAFERVTEDVFQCIIEDNGIGRKKSFEIKAFNNKAKRHKSKGLQIAKDRLDLLERQGMHASVQIVDKYDEVSGEASGTRVAIELSTFLSDV